MKENIKSSSESQEEASLLLQEAKSDLLTFAQLIDKNYQVNWHHELVGQALMEAYKGVQENRKVRILLSLPPRHGKSLLATQMFPAWALGKDPTLPVVVTSYSADLAEKFGLKTKDIVTSPEYQQIFPQTKLRKDTKAKGNWMVTKGGSYNSVGIGGALTGTGFSIGILDDPVKNREDAESATYRGKVWDWYTSTFYTRLEGYGAIIVILTRWHLDDIVGRLLEQQEQLAKIGEPHDEWTILNFPAVAEEDELPYRRQGDPLWPEKFDTANLENIKNTLGVADWSSLYQQSPLLSENQEFKKEYFKYYEPEDIRHLYLRHYTFIDPAISQKKTADNTVVLTVAKEINGPRWFRIEEHAGRYTPSETINLIFKHQTQYRSEVYLETVAYQQALKYAIEEEQRRRQRYFTVNELKTTNNKETRIRGLIPLYHAGVIYHRHVDVEYERELLQFPKGKRDDRIDAMSFGLLSMDNTRSSQYAPQFKKKIMGYFKPQ